MAYDADVRAQIDQAAAEHSQTIEAPAAPATETTLAYGAEGECLTKLVDLLALLGFATNDVIHGKSTMLDETVLADVAAAQKALDIHELPGDELLEPAGIPVGVKGTLITTATWDGLYAAAATHVAPPAGSNVTAGETAGGAA